METILAHPPGAITLVTLGPLTNVAVALGARAGDRRRGCARIVVMGGTGDGVGNVSAVAEFNVWADPEAAAIVFACGAPITMVGWDISRTYATFGPEDAAALRALGPLGAFSVDIQATLDPVRAGGDATSPASTCPTRSRWPSRSTTRSRRARST